MQSLKQILFGLALWFLFSFPEISLEVLPQKQIFVSFENFRIDISLEPIHKINLFSNLIYGHLFDVIKEIRFIISLNFKSMLIYKLKLMLKTLTFFIFNYLWRIKIDVGMRKLDKIQIEFQLF